MPEIRVIEPVLFQSTAKLRVCAYARVSSDSEDQKNSFGNYFLEHAKAAFDIMGMSEPQEEKDAKYILKRLDTIEGDSISVKGLFDLCRKKEGFKTMEEFEPKLDPLIARGYLHIEVVTTGGRPTEKIYINPKYTAQKAQKSQKTRY